MAIKSWNSLAANFANDVLEIASHDIRGVLNEQVARIAKGNSTAADLGCGPGSLLPLVCDKFKKVYAVDYAAELIKVARQRYDFSNVEYLVHDLAGNKALPFRADVTFSVNALITRKEADRRNMMKSQWRVTKKKGACLVVVPSMESVTHVYQALVRCKVRDRMSHSKATAAVNRIYKQEVISPVDGIVRIGGVPTKCFTHDELTIFLSESGFDVEQVLRVEYPWSEEFDHAPRWLKDPYPWDWLAIGRKR